MSSSISYEKPRYFTPGTIFITILATIGILSLLARFIFGIGAVTNLDDQYPWGIWIAIDVACGVALAAGGFMTAFLAHIIHGKGEVPGSIDVNVPAISKHLANIFQEKELEENAVISTLETTAFLFLDNFTSFLLIN